MTDISDVDIYVSPRFPKTFVKLYRDTKQNELIITLSQNQGAEFVLPEGTHSVSHEIETGSPEPIKTPKIPWKHENDRWVKIKT
jgi:hypothetical protein